MRATHKETGVTVTTNESTVRNLGSAWVVQREKTTPAKKATVPKSSEK